MLKGMVKQGHFPTPETPGSRSLRCTDILPLTVLKALPDLVFLLDRSGRFIDCLSVREDELYLPPEQFIGKRLDEVFPASLASDAMDKIARLSRSDDVATLEYEMSVRSQPAWFETRLILVGSHVLALARNVTDRHLAEARLRRNESMLAESQRIAHLGTWEWTIGTNQLFWSDETYRIFGVSPESFEPTIERFLAMLHPDDHELIEKAIAEAVRDRKPYDVEHRIILPGGQVRFIHEQGQVFCDNAGKPLRTLGTACDITERKLAENKLRDTNAALERTTAQFRRLSHQLTQVEQWERERMALVLHDHLQQLLVGARLQVAALEGGLPGGDLLEYARKAAQALDEAIRQSKSLAIDLSPPVLREGGLAEALKWLASRMQETHGLNVQVHAEAVSLTYNLRTVLFAAVKELLLNVVKHAGVKAATVTLVQAPDRQVQVTVSDTGCGFDAAKVFVREKRGDIFGMFSIRERMESLGGHVEVDSAPGKGCRVTLSAPVESLAEPAGPARPDLLSDEGAEAVSTPTERAIPGAGTPIRVLLVDDHTVMRQGLAQLLARDPELQVVGEASSGEMAVHLARKLQPNVILMDVNMPGMNGIEATRLIHAECPERVIIGLSMYEEGHRADEMRQAGASAYVRKDEAADALVATIHSCYCTAKR